MVSDLLQFYKMNFTVMRIKFEKVKCIIKDYRDSKTFPIIYLEKVCHLNCKWTVLDFLRPFEYDFEMFGVIYLSVLQRFDRPK